MTTDGSTSEAMHELLVSGRLDLPHPGGGATSDRHRALIELARTYPVGVARLAEAHCDAMSILAEAGCEPVGGALYGVWASAGSAAWDPATSTISGTKPFCSGLGIVERALVTVVDDTGGQRLLDVAVDPTDSLELDTAVWATAALSDTATGDVHFAGHPVADHRIVGPSGWYLDRVGFWHGACGPAACWAGAAIGLVDAAERFDGSDPHRRAQTGALEASAWGLQALFDSAGLQIDASPRDRAAAEHRARSLRHLSERMCADVLDRFGRAFGPRPFTTEATVARRFADTHLYLRQHHGERELGEIGSRRSEHSGE
ncbi:hypothetical protein [Ilumatobacter nonamiensis]|uniref:hypothetical protein n=1 Tax=Ilumatobacter nonamiensis TaxID=467093 RepID=UPI000349D8E8|nr:hypothetical protein [Ilumatobacter nonamiensis]